MEAELNTLRQLASSLFTDKANAKDVASKGLISLLRCRAANKAAAHHVEALKEETAQGRQSLESDDLVLQNLLYEKRYYEKEIAACRGYVSAFPDSRIALQPEAEFWAGADEDAKTKASTSAHELMLQRLAYEMGLRKAMAKDLDALQATKMNMLMAVGDKEKLLKQLAAHLKSVDEAAKPIQVGAGAAILVSARAETNKKYHAAPFHAMPRFFSSMPATAPLCTPQALLGNGPAIRTLSRGPVDLLPVALYILYSQVRLKCGGWVASYLCPVDLLPFALYILYSQVRLKCGAGAPLSGDAKVWGRAGPFISSCKRQALLSYSLLCCAVRRPLAL